VSTVYEALLVHSGDKHVIDFKFTESSKR